MSPITADRSDTEEPDWDELPAVTETIPALANEEDQDHELRWMAPTPHILKQATVYFEAQGSTGRDGTATDHGADTNPLCAAITRCSVISTPVNMPFQTSPRNHEEDEVLGEDETEQLLTSGIRKNGNRTVIMEPLWFQARSIVWLLSVRSRVQDDPSLLQSRD